MRPRIITILALALAVVATAGAQQGQWSAGARFVAAIAELESGPAGEAASSLGFDSGFSLGGTLGYGLSRDFSLELSLATAQHEVSTAGGLYPGLDGGTLWIAPVSFSLRYTLPLYGRLQPYVGAGATWAWSHDYHASPEMALIGVDDLRIKADPGLAVQAGVDYDLSDQWYLELDLRYLQVKGELEVVLASGALYGAPSLDGHQLVIGSGFGFRF